MILDRRVAAALAVVGLSVSVLSACTTHKKASPSPSTTASAPVATGVSTTSVATSTSTSTSSRGAHVDITLTRTNAVHTPHVDLRVSVKGMVPQLYGGRDGRPVPGTDQNLNSRIDYGDGSPVSGSDGGDVSCRPGAPLVPIDMTFNWGHDYATRGAHTVTFKVLVCQLGEVTKTTTVTS